MRSNLSFREYLEAVERSLGMTGTEDEEFDIDSQANFPGRITMLKTVIIRDIYYSAAPCEIDKLEEDQVKLHQVVLQPVEGNGKSFPTQKRLYVRSDPQGQPAYVQVPDHIPLDTKPFILSMKKFDDFRGMGMDAGQGGEVGELPGGLGGAL